MLGFGANWKRRGGPVVVPAYPGAKDVVFPVSYTSAPSGGSMGVSGSGVTANYSYPIGDYMVFSVDVDAAASPGDRVLTYTPPSGPAKTYIIRVLAKPSVVIPAGTGYDEVFMWSRVLAGNWVRYEYAIDSATELELGAGTAYALDWECEVYFSKEFTLGAGEEFTDATINFTISSKNGSPAEVRVQAQKLVPADYPFKVASTSPTGADPSGFTYTTAYASLAANATTGAKSLDVAPVLKELMQAGHFQPGVPTRVTFRLRPTSWGLANSYFITKSTLNVAYTARRVYPGEVERVAVGTARIVTMLPFRSDVDRFNVLHARIRNDGTQNNYSTHYWYFNPSNGNDKKFVPVSGDPQFVEVTSAINELDGDTFHASMNTANEKVLRLFGTGRGWTAGTFQPGWGFKPVTRSYLSVAVFRAESGKLPQFLIDTFSSIGFAFQIAQTTAAKPGAGYVRMSHDFMTDYGYQTFELTSQPAIANGDIVTLAMWWNHATQQATLWCATTSAPNGAQQTFSYTNGPSVDGVAGAPGSWTVAVPGNPAGMIGWNWTPGKYAFTGMLEFQAGIPADIVDAVKWMHRYVPQGVKGWYPAWRP